MRVDCLQWNEIWLPSGFPLPCISYEMLFILFYLFISLGVSWGKISGKATEEQQEICIVTKGERWLPSISFVLLHFAEFHMKCISIVVCWGKIAGKATEYLHCHKGHKGKVWVIEKKKKMPTMIISSYFLDGCGCYLLQRTRRLTAFPIIPKTPVTRVATPESQNFHSCILVFTW